jgi:hypothetical protein
VGAAIVSTLVFPLLAQRLRRGAPDSEEPLPAVAA